MKIAFPLTILSISLLIGLSACNVHKHTTATKPTVASDAPANPAQPVSPATPSDLVRPTFPIMQLRAVVGEYHGLIPCADCEGIDYHLVLNNDKTFKETTNYKGKDSAPFVEIGKYELLQAGKVVLETKPDKKQFLIKPEELIMLDREGNEIESTMADKYILKKVVESRNHSFDLKKLSEGIDFIATGNEPFWSIEIDFQRNMVFSVKGSQPVSISTPAVEGVKAADADVTRYRAEVESGELVVTVMRQECTDNMSGLIQPYSVRVEVKKGNEQDFTTFNGCGHYTSDYRLNDIWKVTELNGKALNTADFGRGLPTFEFQLAESRVAGNSGCNRFIGPIEIKGNNLKFFGAAMTKMACPNMEFEGNLMELISNNNFQYAINEGVLTLSQNGKIVLKLHKTD